MYRPFKNPTLLILVCALSLVLGFAGCKKDEKQSGLSGTISVTDGSASGVEVMVFAEPVYTSTTSSIWGEYIRHPMVGFPFTPQAAFDWRIEQSSKRASMTTGNDGKFNFPSLSDGDYLIVARKDGYGWTPPIRAALHGQNVDAGTLTLYPEETIPDGGSISQSTHWLAGHHYIITNRASLDPGVTLTIDPGAVVRFGQNGTFLVSGTLVAEGTPEAYIHFTSDEQNNPSIGYWISIRFLDESTPLRFRCCSFGFAQYGALSDVRGGEVEYCYFANISAGAIDLNGSHAVPGDSVAIRHNMIEHIPSGVRVVEIGQNMPAVIEHNAINDCGIWGIEYGGNQGGEIYCNLLIYDGRIDTTRNSDTGGLHIYVSKNVDISQNLFYNCWRSVSTGSYVDSTVVIHHNYFRDNPHGSCVIYIGITDSQRGPSFPTIHDNCFVRDYYTVYVTGGHINTHPINARYNYWGTTPGVGINDCDADPSAACVLYDPWLDDCPADAALCAE